MDFKELFEMMLTLLKRVGVETTAEDIQAKKLTEKDIIEAVISDEKNIKAKVDESSQAISKTIIGKLEKEVESTGITKEQIEAAKGDVKKLIGLAKEHLTKELGKTEDEKQKKIEEYQARVRELELDVKKKEQEAGQIEERFKSEYQAKEENLMLAQDVQNTMLKNNLSEMVANNIGFYQAGLVQKLNGEYDFKQKDGKRVAYKKGTEDPVWKDENSSENATLDDLVAKEVEAMGWKKASKTTHNPAPPAPAGEANEVFNRYGTE